MDLFKTLFTHRFAPIVALTLAIGCATPAPAGADGREFTVLAYNVENLFDLDGVALFDDYQQPPPRNPHPYGPAKLLTKITHIAAVLQQFNDGAGPEIVVFQEFELDRTLDSPGLDPQAFLKQFAGTTVENMLASLTDETAGFPVELFVLKYFEDNGLKGYHVARPTFKDLKGQPAHNNLVFSQFPVGYVKQHPTPDARDILEVGINVDGSPLIIFDNHWKSGASNPNSEPTRIENGKSLRAAIDAVLKRDRRADIIVAGDLNSHYNQIWTVDGLKESGMNTYLKSRGDEAATAKYGNPDLYNLWYELPPTERYSEHWRGYWGTLMHIILTPGLYDARGIQYVDNSFAIASFVGLNTEARFNRPVEWHFFGETGGGFSDHFPVYARFRVAGDGASPVVPKNPGRETPADREKVPVDYAAIDPATVPSADELIGLSDSGILQRYHAIFRVEAKVVSTRPFKVKLGEREYEVWSYHNDFINKLRQTPVGTSLKFLGDLGEYRGKIQFVIQDPSWLLPE